MNPEDVIKELLPKSMSAKRRGELAEQIADSLATWGHLVDGECTTVEVADARMPVETVESYGLTIKLDAMGDAAEISHRSGLVVLA